MTCRSLRFRISNAASGYFGGRASLCPTGGIPTSVALTEGRAEDREGNVYFSDIINQRIMKLSKDGALKKRA